ncbi:MAG: acetylglutamate kinase [Bacillaceae bacterium]|nr:acetylglutamate kinase [Bacillaceae bacterium]
MGKELLVIKSGGSILSELPDSFFQEVAELKNEDVHPVIVHGGGPAISGMLEALNIEPRFKDGLRITDESTLDVVQMVLAGKINKQIVVRIQQAGGESAGISGIDGDILRVVPADPELGYVGKITSIDTGLIEALLEQSYIPVIAPLGIDREGRIYNINADTAAGAIAAALGAERMVMVTDVDGIMKEIDGKKEILSSLTPDEIQSLIKDKTIYGGMIPKVTAALDGLAEGIREVVIVNGKNPGILTRVVRREHAGTRIVKGEVTAG